MYHHFLLQSSEKCNDLVVTIVTFENECVKKIHFALSGYIPDRTRDRLVLTDNDHTWHENVKPKSGETN
jgi:hypothetical protein